MEKIAIFGCSGAIDFSSEICNYLKLKPGKMESMKFKNDNNFVKILEDIQNKDVYVVQQFNPPVNEKIMELLITIDAIKRESAKSINVILPYFPYSRSDKKDQEGIPITAKLIASLIEVAGATKVITCDLHNQAIQAYFDSIVCDTLTAKDTLESYFVEKKISDMVVVATDAGSSKKAYKYAEYFKCPIALVNKQRIGNSDKVQADTIIGEVKNKNCIIFDDEIDTAGSIMETVRLLNQNEAASIYAACTHGVFSDKAIERIKESSLNEVIITNSIPLLPNKKIDKIKVLSIAYLFAEKIRLENI